MVKPTAKNPAFYLLARNVVLTKGHVPLRRKSARLLPTTA
jgi:hypothetical protein